MRNNRLLPYETIVQAASGEPEAVGTVLQYYRRRIQCAARVNGRVDQFNRFAAFFRSCLAFLKIPSMKKQKGK